MIKESIFQSNFSTTIYAGRKSHGIAHLGMFGSFECCVYKRSRRLFVMDFPPGILGFTVRRTVKISLTGEEKFEMRMAQSEECGLQNNCSVQRAFCIRF